MGLERKRLFLYNVKLFMRRLPFAGITTRGLNKMSASREKKQRQDDPSQGLTQKQIKERKEAAIKKRNTVIYTVIGVVEMPVWPVGWWE